MKTLIIAEAGVNHNGNLELAYKLVDAAANAGADIIKFQTYITENLVSVNTKKAEYQINNTDDNDDSQFNMLKKYELSFEDFVKLKGYCDEKKIKFLSTAFDMESIDFLHSLNMGVWKIPSGEITNLPYLIKIANYHEQIILSTGMSDMREIEEAMHVLNNNEAGKITILHCTTEYPAPFEDINLKAMLAIQRKFNVPIGYSDHTKGIEVPIAAVALGASVIEKHFTLNRKMEGPDHKASLEPLELKEMINSIRNIEKALGSEEKKVSVSERKNIISARKSIIAKKRIKKGELFSEENITVKRPGTGISPMRWFEIVNKNANKDYEIGELLSFEEIDE